MSNRNNIDPITKRQRDLLDEIGRGSRGFFMVTFIQNLNLEEWKEKIEIVEVMVSN